MLTPIPLPSLSPAAAVTARRAVAWSAGVLALALAALPVLAQQSGSQKKGTLQQDVPTLIDSDTLQYDDAKQTSVFTGNVVLTRGELTLHADRLELRQNEAGDQFAVATAGGGKQVFVRQVQPGSVEVVEGNADRAEYDSPSEQIDFIGHAVVSRLACGKLLDQIRGERIRYNQQTDVYTATGGPQAGTANRRVRTMIQSREKSDEVIASCPPAAAAPAGDAR